MKRKRNQLQNYQYQLEGNVNKQEDKNTHVISLYIFFHCITTGCENAVRKRMRQQNHV